MNKSDTIAVIRSILSSSRSNYSICRLNVDFKKETGIDIPLFGYGNLNDFLHSIPDTVTISGLYPIQTVSLVKNEKSAHIVSLVNRTKTSHSRQQTSSFRNKKNQESSNFSEGVDFERFQVSKISADKKYYSRNPALRNLLKSSDSQFYLQNVLDVGGEESIPAIDIERHAQVGEYVEICPNQIYNPHKFYFHFRKFKRKFEVFKDKMQKFYKNEIIPEMTERMKRPKLMCAVFHEIHKEPMWCRGEVNEIVSKSDVIVTLVDYGLRARVWKGNLKFLHHDFMSLPRQAVLGSLANISPSAGQSSWSAAAIKRFSALALQKDLIAGVVAIDSKACSMKLALSCTKGAELHINDTLVNEGYAEFDVKVLNNYSFDTLRKPNQGTNNFNKTETDFNEDIFKSVASRPSLETPIYNFSNTFTDNKRLQKMFATSSGNDTFLNTV